MSINLVRNQFAVRPGPVVVVVMDGIAWGPKDDGDAVHLSYKPTMDRLWSAHPTLQLKAHGTAVGMPTDADMGNSEVGHNALGAGRIFDQGAALVEQAIADQRLFSGATWRETVQHCIKNNTTLHFLGLLSDGNVHSHIKHLLAMLQQCVTDGVKRVRLHVLLDGRDVSSQSAHLYVDRLEQTLTSINQPGSGRDYRIASGGGRMLVTMDRYGADWRIVERGWKAHVLGQGRHFHTALQAIESYRREDPKISDQFLGEFVIVENDLPVGAIEDGDAVICFNFRGDRAIEISQAFEQDNFKPFDRQRWPRVLYAGMMQYDGDLKLPQRFLVAPPAISDTLGQLLAAHGVTQYACSETQKYGHVTYFWNGNRSGKFDDTIEIYEEIRSDLVPFEQRPWMKAAEITDATIAALRTGKYRFARINYPNGDMVGHTGDLQATRIAVEAVDLSLARLLRCIDELQGVALVTADHGNADEMFEKGGKAPKTSHTLNPVPFTIYDPSCTGGYQLATDIAMPGLANVAATVLNLLGYKAPEFYESSLIDNS